jgi:hypothetical protein
MADWIDALMKLPSGDVTRVFTTIGTDGAKRKQFAALIEERFPLGATPSADDVWRAACEVAPELGASDT